MQVCEYTVEGNPHGPTLFFIHGWPDEAGLWRKQVAALASDYRCVIVTLPNFGREPVKAGGRGQRSDGRLARRRVELHAGIRRNTLVFVQRS